MIKTCITDLKKAIEGGTCAIATFHNREGLLECEEDFYLCEEYKLRKEILQELIKAKKLLRSQNGWRWDTIKSTKGNPIKLLFLFLAWWRNFKIKSLWQRT
jgi:hypothetical protein